MPRLDVPLVLGVLIGGSGFSVGMVDETGRSHGESLSIPWEEIGVTPDSIPDPSRVDALFDRIFTEAAALRGDILQERIKVAGISFAGPLTGEGDDVIAHGTNMGIRFEAPIKRVFAKFAHQHGFTGIEQFVALNDGEQGVLGEIHSAEGTAPGCEDVVYLILGTGIGGARAVNGKVHGSLKEGGHTLMYQETSGVYSYVPMEQLTRDGLFRAGKFLLPPIGQTYFEHRCGGPWVAVRFAKFLDEHNRLTDLVAAPPKPGTPSLTLEGLQKLVRLDVSSIAEWNKMVEKRDEKGVNIALRFLAASGERSELSRLAMKFEASLQQEIGSACTVLHQAFPAAKIILGSSLAEVRADDMEFLNILTKASDGAAVVSRLRSGTRREVAGFVPFLNKMASAA